MRRFLPLLLISFFLLSALLIVTIFSSGYADQKNPKNAPVIKIYTTLPLDEITPLTEHYQRINNVNIIISPIKEQDLLKLSEQTTQQADLIIAANQTLQKLAIANVLTPYTSETIDIIPNRFKHSQLLWTGIWYDPVVFAFNSDFYRANQPAITKWSELFLYKDSRIAITDFMADAASANMLFSLASNSHEVDILSFLTQLHKQTVQYAKFMSTPVRMAVMGECDIAITVQSTAIRYAEEKFPIKIVIPTDGTPYSLTAIGIIAKPTINPECGQFINWLLQSTAHKVMQENKLFFVSTNPAVKFNYNSANDIVFINNTKYLSAEQQNKLLDMWLKNVRLVK